MIGLVWRSVRFHLRHTLGLLAGIALTTALLVGGLSMGDSLQAFLTQQTEARVGDTDWLLAPQGELLDASIVSRLSETRPQAEVLGVLRLGAVPSFDDQAGRRLSLLASPEPSPFPIEPGAIALTPASMKALDLEEGQSLIVRVMAPSELSRDLALTTADEVLVPLRLTVSQALPSGFPADLDPEITGHLPHNAWVNYRWLSEQLNTTALTHLFISDDTLTAEEGAQWLRTAWDLPDSALVMAEEDGTPVLTSPRILLHPQIEPPEGSLQVSSWLATSIASGSDAAPFPFLTALSGPDPRAQRLEALGTDQLIINDWLAQDLNLSIGDRVEITIPTLAPNREVDQERRTLEVADIWPVRPDDASLSPLLEGITGEDSCTDWDPGLPLDLSTLRPQDEAYWDTFGQSPKAYVSLALADDWWGSRHGTLTQLRFPGRSPAQARQALRETASPSALGLHLQPFGQTAAAGARPANDFGGLFAGFQFVLLTSALLLTSLLWSLELTRRSGEWATLQTLGWTKPRLRQLLLTEVSLLSVVGLVCGLPFGWLVGNGLLKGLNGVWGGAVSGAVLPYTLHMGTLVMAGGLTLLLTLMTLWLRSRTLLSRPIAQVQQSVHVPWSHSRNWLIGSVVFALVGLALASTTEPLRTPDSAARFFGAGGSLMTAGLLWCRWALGGVSRPLGSALSFARANAQRAPARSFTAITLLALGTFLVVGVGLGAAPPPSDPTDPHSGTGGYALYGETVLPVLHDLDTPDGQMALGLRGGPAPGSVLALSRVAGDDASCLNLGSGQHPALLGVSPGPLAHRDAFGASDAWDRFARWLPGDPIPAVGDMSTITWGLHRQVGDELVYVDGTGQEVAVQLVSVIGNSVFQGSLLIPEEARAHHWPNLPGRSVFLFDRQGPDDELPKRLSYALEDHGLSLSTTSERLHLFAAVEETYIQIFAGLGALGVMLGGLGVSIILLRNLIERGPELARLHALGFPRARLRRLLLVEHGGLLLVGIAIGALSAITAVWPSLNAHAEGWTLVAGLVAGTISLGLLVTWLATGRLSTTEALR